MKKTTFLVAVACTTLFSNSIDKEKFTIGEKIYKNTCVSCHGVDGKAKTGMNLVIKPRDLTKTILNKEQIFKVIEMGSHNWGAKSDIMPSFKSIYNKEQINAISFYIYERFSKEQAINVQNLLELSKNNKKISLKKGKKIFKRNCSLCHGLNGNGESEFIEESKAADNFIYPYNLQKLLLNENQIFLYAKYGGKYWGTDKNDMPSWKKKYSDNVLKSVARYIKKNIVKNQEK